MRKISCCPGQMGISSRAQTAKKTGNLNMRPDKLFVEAHCDANFAGEVDDMYSTSGGWIQLTDESGQFFPLAAKHGSARSRRP